ncbi:hypothetical protein LTR91_011361 [Friedmanniomyces endolithicus]|uniref:BTB domain-containing protein n=1 Tax=Friedmanniomyces endolithicus TaxID=329885 RepID=A0AAN6KHV3_9PEZI|nr:hypothetical protein LTR38_013327 [Friedmanniomyces endolithicus]KAK0784944.1 hypothetical protein LTR59_011223 [Friedmanniomyces endolithicus]KAK0816109.1 hypothetical protein LTR75_003682 [Friedmanniomyces endolithicus]KAK0854002.1 hypothetical protein LTR03_002630 [Friedmanniomyces endolithicus]KAK0860151.1 hypothetical protein LTS02_008701 [Friedmanniomyces endolithicus]
MSPPTTAEDDAGRQFRELIESLPADRLIDIYVGEMTPETKPFRVQQLLLETMSDYFKSALQANAFAEGKEARLTFSEDSLNAWKVLMRWAFTRTVPRWTDRRDDDGIDCGFELLLIDCWVLGDKYQIPAFQDEVMLELLYYYKEETIGFDVVKHGVAVTSSGSALRRLLAEEVMTNNMQGGVTEDLNQFDGMHFLADFVTARESYDDTGTKGFFDRFGKERKATLEAGPGELGSGRVIS